MFRAANALSRSRRRSQSKALGSLSGKNVSKLLCDLCGSSALSHEKVGLSTTKTPVGFSFIGRFCSSRARAVPTSPRSHPHSVWSTLAPVHIGVPRSQRRCFLCGGLLAGPERRPQSPELGGVTTSQRAAFTPSLSFRPPLSSALRYAAAHKLRLSPTADAATPPVCAPPPPPRVFWRCGRRVPTASAPSA